MTPRERWRAVLERRPVDRCPCDIWGTDEVFEKLCAHLHCSDQFEVIDKLEIDAPYAVAPRYVGPYRAADRDLWGVGYRMVPHETGAYREAVDHPLAGRNTIAEYDEHPWPSADWFDYSEILEGIEAHAHRPIRATCVEPFLFYQKMRGLEQAMMDLVLAPDLVECAFDHIFEFAMADLQRIIEAGGGQIDFCVPAEDLGSQTGPLVSLDCFRRFHRPRFARFIGLAKQAGLYTFYHTDGAARQFIPDLIDLGVNILNPIQWRCPGMEREGLKADFGDRLVFHGGIDNQHTLPFGTPQDVRDEVAECYRTLGAGGGYICAPCHNLQSNTPVENILAMYETVKEMTF